MSSLLSLEKRIRITSKKLYLTQLSGLLGIACYLNSGLKHLAISSIPKVNVTLSLEGCNVHYFDQDQTADELKLFHHLRENKYQNKRLE